jgi:hypothetical protein
LLQKKSNFVSLPQLEFIKKLSSFSIERRGKHISAILAQFFSLHPVHSTEFRVGLQNPGNTMCDFNNFGPKIIKLFLMISLEFDLAY